MVLAEWQEKFISELSKVAAIPGWTLLPRSDGLDSKIRNILPPVLNKEELCPIEMLSIKEMGGSNLWNAGPLLDKYGITRDQGVVIIITADGLNESTDYDAELRSAMLAVLRLEENPPE